MQSQRRHQADDQSGAGAEQGVAKTAEATAGRKHQLGSHGGQEAAEAENGANQPKEWSDENRRLKEGLGKAHLQISLIHPGQRTVSPEAGNRLPLLLERPSSLPPEDPEADPLKTHRENGNGKKDQQPACGPAQGAVHHDHGGCEDFMQTGTVAPVV